MKRIQLLLITLLIVQLTASAQNEKEAVRSSIDQLFEGMRNNDSLLIKRVLHKDCTLKTVTKDKADQTILQETTIAGFIKTVGTKRPGVQLDERLSDYEILLDGDMATAWTPYEFFVNEQFSHCGVNAFTLIKEADGWKIISVTDTRRKVNCL